MPGVEAEHVRVPDLRLALSIRTRKCRTSKLRSSLLTLAVTCQAVALAAGIAVVGPASPGALARPASAVSTASAARLAGPPAQQASAGQAASPAVNLDSYAGPSRHRSHRHLTPHGIARSMLGDFGWSHRQFRYLDWLWSRESSWNVGAANPDSGAFGIPQAVPGAKMASAGPDWQTSARTQIRWGLEYIRGRYGSPRNAWDHEVSAGWY